MQLTNRLLAECGLHNLYFAMSFYFEKEGFSGICSFG
jgi:ferritin